MKNKLLIFNWKMNPETLEGALDLAKASDRKRVVVAPPFVFLEEIGKILKNAELGAQDVFGGPIDKGAFTGEISVRELKNLGVKYVIVGHSERRHKLGETDEMVAKKLKAAAEGGLTPVLCVGETEKEKGAGKKEEVIKRQLKIGLSLVEKLKSDKRHVSFSIPLVVAYEPVWAIGTGNPETPEDAIETIKYIKKLLVDSRYPLVTKVLYGGSVDSKNLKDYIKYEEVEGALIGGASLKEEEVKKMARIS